MPELAPQSEQSTVPDEVHAAETTRLRTQLSISQDTIGELRRQLDSAAVREHQLAHDLQHRVRNMIAVIRSVYRRSLENGASQDEFAEHFEGRLGAVSRYHGAISGADRAGIDLEDIVRDELLQVHCMDGPNVSITGPPVRLLAKSAELMGLAIHELTTNAIKFGALYRQGKLTIAWSIEGPQDYRILHFHWRENGIAPLTVAPRSTGFGRQLIEEALPYQLGATTSFELNPGGLDCSIILPIPEPDQAAQAGDSLIHNTAFFPSDPEPGQ